MHRKNQKLNDLDDIEIKINIIYSTINMYHKTLNHAGLTEEVYIRARAGLNREERNLQKMKDLHSEYFI